MLTVSEVTVNYAKSEHPALDRVSFDMKPGEVLALLGPNGAGKTTLMKTLTGLVQPQSGTVQLMGHDLLGNLDIARNRVGLVLYPERSFYYRLSGYRNLMFFAAMDNVFGRVAKERVAGLIEQFGLEPFRDLPFMKYSYGTRKKLALARSLIKDPDLILLDEPTASLDPNSAWEVLKLVSKMRSEGKMIILATHQLHEAEQVADKVVFLAAGKVQALGTTSELRQVRGQRTLQINLAQEPSPALQEALGALTSPGQVTQRGRALMVALPKDPDLAALISAIEQNGGCIQEMALRERTLDEVFREVTREAP